jgi:hypothetical protein
VKKKFPRQKKAGGGNIEKGSLFRRFDNWRGTGGYFYCVGTYSRG